MTARAFPLVLCYHAASSTWNHALALPRETIEAQVLRLLRRRWRAVTLEEALSARGRAFHVTFDDAFRSIVGVVEALERHRVPMTVFACTAPAETGAPLAIAEFAREPHDELSTLAWTDLDELAARGVAVESHAVSHPHLRRLSDAELERELRDSKQAIEDRLRRSCRFLAYPYGEHDARVRRAARSAGYVAAFAVRSRIFPRDPFALPRVCVYRGERFARKARLVSRVVAGLTQGV